MDLSVGLRPSIRFPTKGALDTEAGPNIIHERLLPPIRKYYVKRRTLPRDTDASKPPMTHYRPYPNPHLGATARDRSRVPLPFGELDHISCIRAPCPASHASLGTSMKPFPQPRFEGIYPKATSKNLIVSGRVNWAA